jgi:hypothetical protein
MVLVGHPVIMSSIVPLLAQTPPPPGPGASASIRQNGETLVLA